MDVILRVLRHVVVDDVADVLDVQSARGDVGGHQHLEAAVTEAAQRLLPLALRAVGMQHRHQMAFAVQHRRNVIRAILGPAENEHRIVFGAFEQLDDQLVALVVGHGIERVPDGFSGSAAADFDRFGILQRPLRQRRDLRRHSGREQHRLPARRATINDPLHVGQETHVQHPVGFVEDQEFDVIELAAALLHVIEQPARRGDDDIHALAQRFFLRAVTDATVDDHGAQIGEPAVVAERCLHLCRQFARRLQDQRPQFAVLAELGDDGQRKRRGLAGAGLRAADDVAACEHQRDRAQLDRRRVGITRRLDALKGAM